MAMAALPPCVAAVSSTATARLAGEPCSRTQPLQPLGLQSLDLLQLGGSASREHGLRSGDVLCVVGALAGVGVSLLRSRRKLLRQRQRVAVVAQAAHDSKDPFTFGGIKLTGAAAAWLREEQAACKADIKPTPIQAAGMRHVYEGENAALRAPTGTGKTLAYLLPLWQRLVAKRGGAKSMGLPKLLIVVPSEDLQLQVASVARLVAGNDDAVVVLRNNNPNLQAAMTRCWAVVTTTSLLLSNGLVGVDTWGEIAAGLEALVIDEADYLLPLGGGKNWKLGDLLEDIKKAKRPMGRDVEEQGSLVGRLQLVIASASVDDKTLQLLQKSTGISARLIRTGAKFKEHDTLDETGYHVMDAAPAPLETLWPAGLQHKAVVVHGLRYKKTGEVHPVQSTAPIVDTILTVSPRRCLVILAEKRPAAERGASIGKYINRLRRELAPEGYQVITVSAAIQAVAGSTLLEGGVRGYVGPSSKPEVIVGRAEAIRGLDIAGIDAVLIVGQLGNAREYLHLAGRTARHQPGRPTSGMVVSMVDKKHLGLLRSWGKAMGIRIDLLPVEVREQEMEEA
eukprot:TRINITY_DN16909_c0_g2_i1.p1 TRINITY_DN16909_c0_g2~~TRINITY_DN16909_c0_g2_i1.p1  ORF type:complete len:587 (-),score=171.29 TRINITY_DN16909_c0_g2_i1:192-1886(-)